MKFSQYGHRSLTEIRTRYKSYIKQIIDFFNETLEAFKLKQEDLVKIKNNIKEISNEEEFNKVWSSIGKLNLQRRAFLNMIHINLFAYFEAFNKDFFLGVFFSDPKPLLKSKEALKKGEKDKAISYRKILEFSTLDEIKFHLAYKQVDNYSRLSIDDLNDDLIHKFKIDLSKEFEVWEELRESYYRRNAVVHNNSQISHIYAEKMDCQENIGRGLRNNPKYIKNISDNISKYIDFIYDEISAKLHLN